MRFKLHFDVLLKDLDDQPIRAGATEQALAAVSLCYKEMSEEQKKRAGAALDKLFEKELTLKGACVMALMGVYEDEKNLGEQERMQRFELARRINKAKAETGFNTTERDKIKELSRKRFLGPLVSSLIAEALEGATKEEEAAT